MMKINLGVNLSFAMSRYVEPEEWTRIVSEELKLTYVQFFSDLLDPLFTPPSVRSEVCQKIKELNKKYNLRIHSVFSGTIPHCLNLLLHPDKRMRKASIRWYKKGIEMTSEMGSSGYGGFFGAFSRKDAQDGEKKRALLRELIEHWRHLSRFAREKGMKFLLFEPMSCIREFPSTISETRWLYQKLCQSSELPVYLCLDVGHGRAHSAEKEDANPYAWLREFACKNPVVHLQQTDGMVSRHWPFTREFNEQGKIEAEKLIRTLKQGGAKEVFLFLEIMYPPFEPFDEVILDDLKESVNYWKKALRKSAI